MDISVIIPVYNTEKYLSECLESVRKLTELLSVEVIMIDDGSTDRSGEIAEEYAAAHPCFCCVHQENAGMSAVRNRGVSLARGKYLLFVDSDDYIIAEVYARMFETAEKNGTDLTVCDAVQLKDKKYVKFQNTIHAFHNLTDSITHITKHPALIYDTSPCNKLILHSFYIEIGLTFPVGLYYEDVIWTLMLYHRTNAVSVVREIGYVYRIRSGGTDQSITQKMFQAKNMDDKENVTHQVFEYLQREFPAPQLWLEAQRCHWTYHYGSRFSALGTFPPDEAEALLERFARFIEEHYDPAVAPMLSVLEKQILKDVFNRDLDHLQRVMNYKKMNWASAPVIEEEGNARFLLPDSIFTIEDRSIGNEFDRTPPRCLIDKASATDRTLILDAHVYHRRINILPGDQTVEVSLFNAYTGEKHIIKAEPILCEALTKSQGATVNADDYRTYRYNYDGTGFRVQLDFPELEENGITPGVYMLMLQYSNRIFSGARLLRGTSSSARGVIKKYCTETDGFRIRTDFDVLDTLRITIE